MTRIARILAFTALSTLGLCAFAQTPAPTTGFGFGVTGEAVGINLNKQWHMATDAVETASVVNSAKLGAFYIEGHETTSTDGVFGGYFGGLKWIPKIDGLLAKTTIPPQTFQVYVHAAPGFVRTAAGSNKLGGIVGGGLDYDPSASGHFAVNVFRVDYLNAPGFGASPHGFLVSSGIAVFFGGTK